MSIFNRISSKDITEHWTHKRAYNNILFWCDGCKDDDELRATFAGPRPYLSPIK